MDHAGQKATGVTTGTGSTHGSGAGAEDDACQHQWWRKSVVLDEAPERSVSGQNRTGFEKETDGLHHHTISKTTMHVVIITSGNRASNGDGQN